MTLAARPDPEPAPRPAPPKGFANWLDYVLEPVPVLTNSARYNHARAELAELRKDLTDIAERLAKQCEMTLEAMQQRDAAQAERDEAKAQVRYAADFHAEVCEPTAKECDSLRAQVAELRTIASRLGRLEALDSDRYGDALVSDVPFIAAADLDAHNAIVDSVRAEAPAQGKEEQ